MLGIYRPRHPERTAFYRVLFHNFDRFLTVYEGRFEKEYGHFRPVVKEVVERYLDRGSPLFGDLKKIDIVLRQDGLKLGQLEPR